MPITNYSVLKGRPTAGRVVKGSGGTHYRVTVTAAGGPFTVAVNIVSSDGSEVLYDIDHTFVPPDPDDLAALPTGMTKLQSEPDGLALDFVREQIDGKPMITQAAMTLLPKPSVAAKGKKEPENLRAEALNNGVTMLIAQAIKDPNSTIYAFGSSYADSGKVDGIHDIHMNQGNPVGSFSNDNGIWQDGAIFLQIPTLNTNPTRTWVAVFIAFQTESWATDDSGNPL